MADAEFTVTACDPQNFSAVDSDKWTCIKNKVRDQYGFTVNTDKGTASQNGFTFTWNYDPGAQTLEVQCTDHPFFVPCAAINDQIQGIARDCGAVD